MDTLTSMTTCSLILELSLTEFSYDDPTISYAPLSDHDLDQSPCYPIIVKRESYFCCKLRPGIKNVHLESKHHLKYRDPEIKIPQTYSWLDDPIDR